MGIFWFDSLREREYSKHRITINIKSNMGEVKDDSWRFRFNKEFNLTDWLEMEPPPHISESNWRFAVMELHTLLETEAGKKEPDKLFPDLGKLIFSIKNTTKC